MKKFLKKFNATALEKVRLDKIVAWFFGVSILLFLLALNKSCLLRTTPQAYQFEAKIVLSQAYGNLKYYYSEHSKYDFKYLTPFREEESIKSNYIIGIPFACAKALRIPERKAYYDRSKNMSPEFESRRSEAIEYLRNAKKPEECSRWDNGFEVYAIGFFRGAQRLDVWRISESKVLENVQSGI